MPIKRRRRGFEAAGHLNLEGAGLPRAQARSLRLAHAWAQTAGNELAQRIEATRVQRGILDLVLIDPDPSWKATIDELIPELAARMAANAPDLRIRKFRFSVKGEERVGVVQPLPEVKPAVQAAKPAPRRRVRSRAVEDPEDRAQRLQKVMERYLERADQKP